jgi:penicillin amidase
LYGRKVPHGGDPYTVNVANVKWDGSYGTTRYKTQSYLCLDMDAGPSYRQIIDMDNPSNSVFVHPIGQSGNLFSPYFENLLGKWQRGEYLPMITSNYNVDHTVVLIP